MVPATAPDFAGACVRVAPRYRFVPIDSLPISDQAALGAPGASTGWAGALVPAEPGWRRIHLVTAETASLLASLRVPTPIAATGDRTAVVRLILDGILEAEWDGGFHSGPAAHPLFFPSDPPPLSSGRLARLSLDALRYAGSLDITDPLPLADRLYRYNTCPASPEWRRRVPDARAATRLVEANRGRTPGTRAISEDGFSSEGGSSVWRVWSCRNAIAPLSGAATFKLYLSPNLSAFGDAWSALVGLFNSSFAPFAIKVGRDLTTLLRPDKLVAYFTTHEDLLEAASSLQSRLAGLPAQGVPFTAELSGGGLVSWGVDPADAAEPPGPRRRKSWRGWITDRLAAAIASVLQAKAPVPAWRYALDRISLDGVDLRDWIPPAWFTGRAGVDADH